jgi:hypothetical protein
MRFPIFTREDFQSFEMMPQIRSSAAPRVVVATQEEVHVGAEHQSRRIQRPTGKLFPIEAAPARTTSSLLQSSSSVLNNCVFVYPREKIETSVGH